MSNYNHNIISQEHINASKIETYVPSATVNTEIVFSDSLYNINHKYSNIFPIETSVGMKHYGIRTMPKSDTDKLTKTDIPNVSIVKLYSEESATNIYAFDNEYNFVVKDELQGSNLYNSYTTTYEWVVDGKTSGIHYTYAVPLVSEINESLEDPYNTYINTDINDTSYTFNIYTTLNSTTNTYTEVPYNTSTTSNVYVEKYIPFIYNKDLELSSANLGLNSNVIFTRTKNDLGVFTYNQILFDNNTSDYSYLYVRDLDLEEITRDNLNKTFNNGDEYYISMPTNVTKKYPINYVSKKFGLNLANNEYFGLTYVMIQDNSTIIQNNNSINYYLTIDNFEEITSEDVFKKLIDNNIQVYTIKSSTGRTSFTSDYIYNDKLIVDSSILYENSIGDIISLEQLKENNGKSLINSIQYVNTMKPSMNVYIDNIYKTGLYYVKANSKAYIKIDYKYVRNDFLGIKYYVYEIGRLNESQINAAINNSDYKLYANSELLYPTQSVQTINGEFIYYSEIDKTNGVFINNDLHIYKLHKKYELCTDITRISSKRYYIQENVKHENLICTKQEFANYIIEHASDNVNYIVQQAQHKTSVITYKIIDDNSIGNKPEEFFKQNPTYVQCIKTKYYYKDFVKSNGIKTRSNGINYTNIGCFNNQRLTIYNSLDLSIIKTINTKTYYFYVDVIDKKLLTNESQFVFTDNEQYYYDNKRGKIIQLSNLDEPAINYFKLGYDVYIKNVIKQRINYDVNNNAYRIYGPASKNIFNIYGDIYGIYAARTNKLLTSNGYIISNNGVDILYELDIVELYQHIIQIPGQEIQSASTEQSDYVNTNPLYLANEFTYVSTGDYNWVAPQYKDRIYIEDNIAYWKTICSNEGHWEENFEKQEKRLSVSSYVYYDNTTDNITTTYTLFPDSKVLSSEIIYPQISYQSLITNTKKFDYYTYNVNAYSYIYNLNDKVEEINGYSYGIVNNQRVELHKHNIVKENTEYGTYIAQDEHIERNYFTYKNSIQLSNAQVPELLSVQLCPQVDNTFNVFNEDGTTYASQSFATSLSYYSYEYILKDKPFLVTSTIQQDDALVIENIDNITSYIKDTATALNNSNTITYNGLCNISENIIKSNITTAAAAEKISYTTKDVINAFGKDFITNTQKLENQLSNINITLSALSPLTVNNAIEALGGNVETVSNINLGTNKHGVIKGTKIYNSLTNSDYKLVENLQIGDNIISCNKVTNENYISTVKNIQTSTLIDKLAKILLENGDYVVIGENTPVLTETGFKSLTLYNNYPELTISDMIVTINGLQKISNIVRFENTTSETIYIIDVVRTDNTLDDNFYANNICVHNEESTGSTSTTSTSPTFNVTVNGFNNLTSSLTQELSKGKSVNVYSLGSYLTALSNNITKTIKQSIVGEVSIKNTNIDSLNELLAKTLTAKVNNEDYTFAEMYAKVNHFENKKYGAPYRAAFIADTAKLLFTAVDYENDIIDNVEYDENGNIINKQTHKNNAFELAKKSVIRANALWEELVKEGIVDDENNIVKDKQDKLNKIKAQSILKSIL